ncbi:MAG TPA: FAD-binding oxidoreductase [Polyangiaceae bacterium]|nr:FAD-binding oxidoreductase [Polyangiaceae bacterium]
MTRRRSFWAWGWEDESVDPKLLRNLEPALAALLGASELTCQTAPTLDHITLPEPRFVLDAPHAAMFSRDAHERASHTYGKSYRDLVRGLAGDFARAPDYVAFPRSEHELAELLDWCQSSRVAAVPYGGGSSVCGGTEADVGGDFKGAVSIDMTRMQQLLEVDRTARAARIQAGVLGPALEEQLREHGYTLRHYPQSFEFSTLGGWLATRSGGHFATLYTHIDELVESMRLVTPNGVLETQRLPASGAGPNPDRLLLGSEGIFGVISEAWMRVFERPRFRANFSAEFPDFFTGARAARTLAQAGLYPANCRLLDPLEAWLNGAASGATAVLIVGFESSDHPLDHALARAAECCRDCGGTVPESSLRTADEGATLHTPAARAWRDAFLRAPYLRDALVQRGVFVETFETAVTWSRFEELHAAVEQAAQSALPQSRGQCIVTCRLTHVYPDGAAPYFTVLAPAEHGSELAQWQRVKDAMTFAMLEHGGTTTHHHAVGRDFRKYYETERPALFLEGLRALKNHFDPGGIMNPGVLLAP